MFVFDSHAHIFPALRHASGYRSVSEHLRISQRAMHEHLAQPARRTKDNETVVKKLWNIGDSATDGMLNVDFHAGEYGRFEWQQDSESCYIQYLPPYLNDLEMPADLLKAMMDYAGVHAAVLQCGAVYGKLNRYFKEVSAKEQWTKGIFYPLMRINEDSAYTAKVQRELIELYEAKCYSGLWFAGRVEHFSPKFDAFWKLIKEINLPVFLLFFPDEHWVDVFKDLTRWARIFGDIDCVLAQAFPLPAHRLDAQLSIPKYTEQLIYDCAFKIEVIYPIGRGVVEEYPFEISRSAVKKLYHTFGPSKLVWGSDLPMVERYCTYKQSLNYLAHYCDFIPQNEMEMILGKNLQEIFSKR